MTTLALIFLIAAVILAAGILFMALVIRDNERENEALQKANDGLRAELVRACDANNDLRAQLADTEGRGSGVGYWDALDREIFGGGGRG